MNICGCGMEFVGKTAQFDFDMHQPVCSLNAAKAGPTAPALKLERSIAPRPGFHKHHDAQCEMEYKYTTRAGGPPVRAFFCHTHTQWAYEHPTQVTYTFEDGETVSHERQKPTLRQPA